MDRSLFIKDCPYPDDLLKGREQIEANVIGCLFQDPLLLDDNKILTAEKFICKRCRTFYEIIQRVRAKGFSSIDAQGIFSILGAKGSETFENWGGMDAVRRYMDGVNVVNWEIYLDDLVRENSFCSLWDMNIDCTKSQEWNGETIVPLKVFRKQRNEDLMAFWDAKLAGLPESNNSKIIEKGRVELDDDWIESLKEGTESGDPFEVSFMGIDNRYVDCYPMLSRNVSGLLPGTTTMLGAYSSVGKSTWWVSLLMSMLSLGKKVLVVSNEEPMSKIKQKIFVWIAHNVFKYDGISKKKLVSGQFDQKDQRILQEVKKFWADNGFAERLNYIFLNDPDIGLISKNIREFALKDGVEVVLYDTFKIQGEDMKSQRQDLALVRDSRTLDMLAKKYGLIMLCSVQLAEHMKGKLWLDSSCLSNSKQIKEQLENLFLIRNCYEEEIDPSSKYYLRPFRKQLQGDIWVSTDVQLNPEMTYKVLFIEKSRGGANSSDTGTAILLEFDGDHSTFKEVCRCRPRHGAIT